MDEKSIRKLNKLKKEINCSNNFQCIANSAQLHCSAKYLSQSNLLECLEANLDCEFCKIFSPIYICTCPVRKKIALYFEEIKKTDK